MSSPSIVETTSTKVFNANNLSIFGSIAIHALVLGIALPSLSVFSPKEKSGGDRDVGLIELNEIEQSRLPNFSGPSLEVPAYPDLNALDNSLSNPSSFPSSLPNSIASLPPPPATSLPSVPFNNNIPVMIPPRSMLPAPPPNALPAPPPQYSYQTPPEIASPNESNRPNFETPREAIDPRDLINQRVPTLPQNRTPSGDLNQPQQTATIPQQWQGAPPVNPAEALREQRIRRLVAESIQGAENLMADKTNTTNEEARKNDVSWRTKVGQAEPQEIRIIGNYPRAACMRKLEGQTVYGVMVDKSGRVANSPYLPYLIKSAGYPILNQQALKEVRAGSFPNQTGAPQAYQITVDFQFNEKICPSLAVAQPETPRNNSDKPAANTPKPEANPNLPPVTPQEQEERKPSQPPSQTDNSRPTSPRRANELNVPNQPASEVGNENSQPNPLREATELTKPNQPPLEVGNPTPTLRKKPERETTAPNKPPSEAVSEPKLPRNAPEAREEAAPPKPKPNRETPASASFRKPLETRPLGVSAPKKPRNVESERSKPSSEALRRESEEQKK